MHGIVSYHCLATANVISVKYHNVLSFIFSEGFSFTVHDFFFFSPFRFLFFFLHRQIFDSFLKEGEENILSVLKSLQPSIRLLDIPPSQLRKADMRGTCSLQSLAVLLSHNHLLVNTQIIPPSVLVSKFKVNTSQSC